MSNRISEMMAEERNHTALRLFGMTTPEAWGKRICIQCKEPADAKCPTPAGKQEYAISALCESCYDEFFPLDTPQRRIADQTLEAVNDMIAWTRHRPPEKSDA